MATFFARVKDKIKAKYRLDVQKVVHEYDAFLQNALVTTCSFQNILNGKLNRKRRALQLAIIIFVWIYFIPRYCLVSFLYLQQEKTRIQYQYILGDYNEEMGMLGRTFNVGYIIFAIGIIVNAHVTRKFEAEGSLEFLTDWLKRIPKKTQIQDGDTDKITIPGDLDNESRYKLVSGLHYKLIFTSVMARNVGKGGQLFELTGFSVFIYKRRPSFFVTCVALWHLIIMLICLKLAAHYLHSLYLSYVVTTDYFKVVINNIIRKVEELKTKEMTNRNVTPILDEYDFMMNDFKKYNRVLKPLLGNLVHFYNFGLTTMLFMFTIKAEIWMVATMILVAGGYSFIMFATGVYVSQLLAKVIELHNTVVSVCARHAGDKRNRLSLNCMFRLKHIICELGSLEKDGQFVIGLRDGEGAATSRMEIFDMTMETLSSTLMIIGFFNGMDAM